VVIENINSGGNSGNAIAAGDIGCAGGGSGGGISIDGGTVDNSTNIGIDVSGGTAIADASGGDDNLAAASGDDDGRNGGRRVGPIRSRYGLGGRGIGGNIASAGNGGRANASADGGIVVIGEINSGGNRGNTIDVGNIGSGSGAYGECGPVGPVFIDGGDVDNSTNLNIDASGGTAIADASGGSGNLAAVSGNDGGVRAPIRSRYGIGGFDRGGFGGNTAAAGNGGIAGSSADGGIVLIDEINSGGNQGNTISVGDICAGPPPAVHVPEAPAPKPSKPGKPTKPGRTIKAPAPKGGGKGGGKVRVTRIPSTGVGHVPTAPLSTSTIPAAVLPLRWDDEELIEIPEDEMFP
jgi:hypothetical protein